MVEASDLPRTTQPRKKGDVPEMICGRVKHSLDTNNRLFIPAKMRDGLGAPFYVTKSLREKCLSVFSGEEWEKYIAPIRQQERKISEKVLRYLHEEMAQVSPDSQGRIVLPQELIDFAALGKVAVILGCDNHVEIWDEALYAEYKARQNVDEMREDLERLGL